MRASRFTPDQILAILAEADAGAKTDELCRRHGISRNTFDSWRKKYGGLSVSDATRLRQLEDRLQHPVDRGGMEQVLSARDVGDAFQRIIVDDGNMVAGADILARQHHVAPGLGIARHQAGLACRANPFFPEREIFSAGHDSLCHVEPQRIGLTGDHAALALPFRHQPAEAGIDGSAVRVFRAVDGIQFGPSAEARVKQPQPLQPVDEGDVLVQVFRLAADRLRPFETKPGKVFEDAVDKFLLAAEGVDVLDAQGEQAVMAARLALGEQGRVGVTEVQPAIGAGGEPEPASCHLISSACQLPGTGCPL